jgi:hypothetical protein
MRPSRAALVGAAVATLLSAPAVASFHLMQIEQLAGGFCGNADAQAIQLRMRSPGQNLTAGAQLVAYDDAGVHPVVLLVLPSNVANGVIGSHILLATEAFESRAGAPPADFILDNAIPASYLAAGRLTWESPGGATIYWSLAWGGSNYTGSNFGDIANDADGNFGPPWPDPLAADGDQALQFQGPATAMSTNNAADYAVSPSPATFANNAGASATILGCLFLDGFESGDTTAWSAVVP